MESGLGTDTWGKGKAQLLGSAVSLSVIFSAGTVIFGFFFFYNEYNTMKLASLCKMASAIFYSLLAIKSNGHFKRVRDVNVANKHFQLPLRSSFLCNPVDFGSFYSGFVD